MAETILITGSTGKIGSNLVKMASENGVQVRATVRSKAKATHLPNVEWVEADFDKPETFDAALKGIEKVFVLSPFVPTLGQLSNDLVDRAKKAGVKHIVRLSATGADSNGKISLSQWQGNADKHIQESGLAWTLLRPTFFMENFFNFSPLIKSQSKYFTPHGNGKAPYIASRDIAAVALEALTGKGHEGKTYELSGPQSLSDNDVAQILSRVAGRTISYVDVPEDAARQGMLGSGMPQWMVDSLMELNYIIKQGWTANVATTLKDLTGREATTFEQFAIEHKNAWS